MGNETNQPVRRVLAALARLVVVLACSQVAFSTVSAQTIPAPQYPLKLTAGKTHLIDQNNRPFFINGDTAWSLVVNTTQAEATQYLQDRAAKGYNAIIVNLIDPAFGENVPNNLAGDPPFTTPNNFTTPGTAYWNHVDWVLSEAAANGIVVFAHPLYLGVGCGAEGWCQAVKDSPVAAMTTYGEFLGQRYANQPNIVWVIGADANPVAEGVESKVMAMVNGIKTYDSVHLMTAHNFQQSAIAPAWADNSWIDLNTIYTYSNTHQVTLDEYNRADTRPIFLQETRYEREFGATDLEVRRQAWWAVLSGAQLGHFFGNCPIWGFDNVMGICSAPGGGWQGQLNSTLSNDLSYVGKLFASRAFHLLIPDQTSSVMTAGVQSGATKATTARATDGSSVIAYIPTSRQVTIDMTKVAGSQGHAWWFNPRDASTVDLGVFANSGSQNFTPPDGNDWVLVIDNASLNLPAPGTGSTRGPRDFNGDGRSDILWRHTDGTNYAWQLTGTIITSQGLLPNVPGPDWAIAGIGDFNGDGKADILWRHTNGTNYVWHLDGSTINAGVLSFVSQGLLPGVPGPNWTVAGIGDFNGDGKADILWRHTDGTNYVWHVNGATINDGVLAIPSQGLLPTVDATWSVAGVGDYNGDGKTDVLWRRNDGTNYVWHVDGTTINGGVLAIPSQGLLPAVDNTWSVAGVGDYNGDGKADVLWRSNDGTNYVWHVDGTTINGGVLAIPSQGLLPSVTDMGWSVVGAGDYNGDGRSDVLWRHANGTDYVWHVDGSVINAGVLSIPSQGNLPSVSDIGWQVQNPK